MTSFNQFTIVYHFGAIINFSLWLRLSWPCRSEEHGMSIAWDPGGGERFFGRSWGRMVTVLARILRIWGSKPEGQEITRNVKNAQDLCHGLPWSMVVQTDLRLRTLVIPPQMDGLIHHVVLTQKRYSNNLKALTLGWTDHHAQEGDDEPTSPVKASAHVKHAISLVQN